MCLKQDLYYKITFLEFSLRSSIWSLHDPVGLLLFHRSTLHIIQNWSQCADYTSRLSLLHLHPMNKIRVQTTDNQVVISGKAIPVDISTKWMNPTGADSKQATMKVGVFIVIDTLQSALGTAHMMLELYLF